MQNELKTDDSVLHNVFYNNNNNKQVLILDPTVGDPSPPVSWAFLIVGGSPHHEGYMHFE